jgi:integrase
VKRELVLIGTVLEIARREWGWIAKNPVKDVTKPTPPPPRDRRISDAEIERICFAFGYEGGEAVLVKQRCAIAFLFAIETAMRAGEICGLALEGCGLAKAGGKAADYQERQSAWRATIEQAVELLELLPADTDSVFNVLSGSLSTMFRAARQRAGIDDLTFHDTRHEAITRLASVFNPLELARVVGHSNLSQLLVYYNATAEDLAGRLG